MANSKKSITFRASLDTEIKLAKIETYLKENKQFESKNDMFNYIIDVAYKTLIDGTSSIQPNENSGNLESKVTEKIDEGMQMISDAIAAKKKASPIDFEHLLLEMYEDIELILKLLPYSKDYRNPDKSEKTSEILRLVEAKSMFRKYTEKKAETILKQKRKGENKNGKQL